MTIPVNLVVNNVTIPVTPRQNSVTTTALTHTQDLGNSPKWTTFEGISKYPTPDITVTAPPMSGVVAVVSGPYGIGDSRGRLDARRWVVGQSNGKIVVRYSKG